GDQARRRRLQPHAADAVGEAAVREVAGLAAVMAARGAIMAADVHATAEGRRLAEGHARAANWQRWGPYLSERQWGTVREDYSANGDAWGYFPHDHARSRAYRWSEDGIGGICD